MRQLVPSATLDWMHSSTFIRLTPVLELIETAIYTGYLVGEKPVSIVLIAQQESAKTESLKHFLGTKSVEYFSDLTSKGLAPYKSDIESGRIRHLCLLDLVRILAHPRITSERTIQTLASLIEEGQGAVADGGGVDHWKNFPRIGAMIAVTPAIYQRKRKMFRDTGFMSRFLPVRFSYTEKTQLKVHESIRNGAPLPTPRPIQVPKEKILVTIPDAIAKLIEQLAMQLGQTNSTYGFRWHRAMRALIKAYAAKQGRKKVIDSDYMKLAEWTEFFSREVEI